MVLLQTPTGPPPVPGRRAVTVVVLVVLLIGIAAVGAQPSTAGSASRQVNTGPSLSFEATMMSLLNDERRDAGLAPLRRVASVDNVAREWSDTMARAQHLSHRPSLGSPFTGDWQRLGENVGVGYSAQALHNGFMRSDGHRANVLGDFDHVGVGVALAGSHVWITYNFVKGDPTTAARYATNPIDGYATGAGGGGPFYDIDGSVHAGPITELDRRGIAVSCATGRYCPDEPLRRAELARMVVTALDLPAAPERFTDVPSGHPYADAIGALAAAGITKGCNPPANDRFCPEESMTRDQMASFLVRALELRPTSEPFADVTSRNVHHLDIGGLARSGITYGCNPPNNSLYCPVDSVTRGQMASFLLRALNR